MALVSLCVVALVVSTAHSGIVGPRQDMTSAPWATVKNGTYAGTYSAEFDQDFFLGMAYAEKATRFTPPQPLLENHWHDVQAAWDYPKHCVGYGGDQIGYEISEDCLYLNVVRPAGVNASFDLPVAVWIHGGGLVMGGSGDRRYNLSFIVDRSVEMKTPMVGVSINYRLSAFGFLGGQQALDAGATNIGFRDQRLALQWVHENIGAFGGDPDKVTIFGESSGAESVAAQVLAYGGRDDGLFRAAIGESGFTGPLFRAAGGLNATDIYQANYDNLVNETSCASLVGTAESLSCLRELPLDDLHQVLNETSAARAWAPVLDGDFIANYPSVQVAAGHFPKIPIIIGANTDEGTAFGSRGGTNLDTDEELADALRNFVIPNWVEKTTGKSVDELTNEILAIYPNNQSVGIPSLKTWPDVIEPGTDEADEFGVQYRRRNAIFGDLLMFYARRNANIGWSRQGIPSYAYRFDVKPDYIPKQAGATHFQEVAFVFMNYNGNGYSTNPFSGPAEYREQAMEVSKTMATAWISFITGLDPNGASRETDSDGPAWPVYDASVGDGVGQEIVWALGGNYVELDDARRAGIRWMMDHMLCVFGT